MKKFFIIFVINIATIQLLSSQCDVRMYDIYTPKGTPVVTFLMCESSLQDRLALDSYFAQTYPQAIQLKTHKEGNDSISSTRKFNCHGYAWLKVETGIDRWIGTGWANDITDPERVFITDGSYIKIPQETYPGKVFWNSGDHTAVTTNQQGIFISKWNEYPLMKHAWNYSPYGTNDLKYYIKAPSISGPSTICSQATYTINNLTEGAVVQWSVNRNLNIVTGQGTDSVVVQKRMDGIGIISAVVSINGQDIPLPQKTIQAGTDFPVFALYDAASNMQVQVGTVGSNHYFQATGSNLPAYPADFYWTVVSPNPDEIPMNFSGRQFSYSTNEEGYYSISLKINGECGWSAENTQSIYFQDTNNGFVLSPNPASSTVTVEVAEETPLNNSAVRMSTDTKTGSINYTIQLWNSSGLLKQVETDQPSYQLDLTGVPPGFYYVHVIKDGQTYRRQLVVQ